MIYECTCSLANQIKSIQSCTLGKLLECYIGILAFGPSIHDKEIIISGGIIGKCYQGSGMYILKVLFFFEILAN